LESRSPCRHWSRCSPSSLKPEPSTFNP
jgi:hypothetical protein